MRLATAFALWIVLLAALPPTNAAAGVMTREELARLFPSPLIVGERDATLPVWPVTRQNGTRYDTVAWVFESMDLAPIPGFSGTPPNLLIALGPTGEFMEVRVLSQHEPVFLDGLGPDPLFAFVTQYAGVNLRQNVKIASRPGAAGRDTSANVVPDGAIERSRTIRYQECFQRLDCVGVYHDPARCAPLRLHARKGRRVVPIGLVNTTPRRTA